MVRHPVLYLIFTIIAIASMFTGNLLALFQSNVKRILAYSSISHLGYILVTLLASGAIAATAAAFYLSAYFITTLGAFGVVTILSEKDRDADSMDDYRGLAWRRPWLAGVFTAMLLSLGIPLTAGSSEILCRRGRCGQVSALVIIRRIAFDFIICLIVVLYTRGEEEMIAIPGCHWEALCSEIDILCLARSISCTGDTNDSEDGAGSDLNFFYGITGYTGELITEKKGKWKSWDNS
jgi:NADH-quinone oxidoreductase subunit N